MCRFPSSVPAQEHGGPEGRCGNGGDRGSLASVATGPALGQIGADRRPALASVVRFQEHLSAEIKRRGIVRGHDERGVEIESEFFITGAGTDRRPHTFFHVEPVDVGVLGLDVDRRRIARVDLDVTTVGGAEL